MILWIAFTLFVAVALTWLFLRRTPTPQSPPPPPTTTTTTSTTTPPPSTTTPTPTSTKKAPSADVATARLKAAKKTRCVIIFATIAGSTERFARELATRLARHVTLQHALTIDCVSAEHYDPDELLNEDGFVLLLSATYTEGTAPASAARLFEWLTWEADSPRSGSALRRVQFAVFGLGNSVYGKFFNAAGRTFDRCLYQLGASRLIPRGIGDESRDILAHFDQWCESLIAKMLPQVANGARPVAHASAVAASPAAAAAAADAAESGACGSGGGDDSGACGSSGGDDNDTGAEPIADMEDMGGLDGEVDAATTAELLRIPNEERREMLTDMQRRTLSKQGYQLLGSHSAVKMCRWTKAQLRGRGGCYKHTFYGIVSYLCMETTPSLACANKCVFCVSEGTLVSLGNGVALPIEQIAPLVDAAHPLLALNADGTGLTLQQITAFTDSGLKACVELWFEDGRTLVCTPDHRVRAAATATQPARWIEAGDLSINDAVEIGPDFASSSLVGDAASAWRIDLRESLGFELSVATPAAAVRAFAFARICGWLLADVTASLSRQVDVDAFVYDLGLLTDSAPTVTHDGTVFRVTLPSAMSRALRSVGVELDARNRHLMRFPAALTADSTPDVVVREFLGGLFGAAGQAPLLSHEADGEARLTDMTISCAKVGELVVEQRELLHVSLVPLLARLCVSGAVSFVQVDAVKQLNDDGKTETKRQRESDVRATRVVPDSELQQGRSYKLTLQLSRGATIAFADNIGFRFCSDKQVRLAGAAAFYRSTHKSLAAAMEEFQMSSIFGDAVGLKTRAVVDNEESLARIAVPTQRRDAVDEQAMPTFRMRLIGRRDVGMRRVYDITVPLPASKEGSFVANGVVVHNCWRHHKNPVGRDFVWKMDPPEMLVEEAVKKHVGMIKQLRGVPGVVPERLAEAFTPRHCALSLVGEPIVYPEINRFCELLHERGISSFLVTNAQFPEQMETLKPITQLYISCDAASKDELKAVDRPIFEDFWERFLTSIDALSRKQQRTVFRLTLVDQMNMTDLSGYAALIRRGHPDLIEVKGVTYCGSGNTNPLTMANVPWHHQVVEFSQRLAAAIGNTDGLEYGVASEHAHSNCVLLARRDKYFRDGKWWTWIDFDKFLELVKSNKPFTSLDYMLETPAWAQFGAPEQGFDPAETRFRRNQVDVEPVATGDGGC